MAMLVRMLAGPLAKAEGVRTEEESMVIELMLALLLNLLHTRAPDAPPPAVGEGAQRLTDVGTLREMLVGLDREHGVELLIYVLQQVEESETHRAWNLTLLEILFYVLSSHEPAALFGAKSAPTRAHKEGANAGPSAEAGAEAAAAPAAASPAAAEDAAVRGDARGEGSRTTPRTGPRAAAAPGSLGAMLEARNYARAAGGEGLSRRHGNFGTTFHVPSEFGDKQYVRGIQAMSTDAVVPAGQRRRTPRNKMPMAAPAEPRAHPGSAKVVKSLVESLLQGPFNALTGTVMKDLEGYAFGSNQFNAAKVLPQDHTIFAATAAWVLEAHRATQAEERAKHPDTPFDVSPVGALADVGVFNLALRLCREFEDRKHWMQLTVMVRLLKQLFLFLDEMVRWEWGGVTSTGPPAAPYT